MRIEMQSLLRDIEKFTSRFIEINEKFRSGIYLPEETKQLLVEYTDFILNTENRNIWEVNVDVEDLQIKNTVSKIQKESAYCVCIMEKYRARELLTSGDTPVDYFKNVEGCIENEFRYLDINENSKVLLVGVGSFPMTPLIIARNIRASVVGIDIDEEAVEYAREVIEVLGSDLDITVTTKSYAEIEFTSKATHIIIASTILEKFDILNQLYAITNNDVIVMMRYGNGFKSLFNYPLVDELKSPWKQIENICYEDNVFDVAIYKK